MQSLLCLVISILGRQYNTVTTLADFHHHQNTYKETKPIKRPAAIALGYLHVKGQVARENKENGK